MVAFTEVHRYDDRKTYKEAWTAWLAHDEIAAMLKAEVERLTDLGYKGDVADKLFKSGRYYFRGAPHTPASGAQRLGTQRLGTQRLGTQRLGTSRALASRALASRALAPNDANDARRGSLHAEPVGVRDVPIALVPTARPCLCAPRKYVLLNRDLLSAMDDHIECGLRHDDNYTPARGFAEFCKLNIASYHSEVARLSEIMHTGEAVGDKLKKTYKNRYFMLVNANANANAFA